ncbi:MAG: hypothetical protein ACFFBP_12730, partial [Promethearchaeota archaeon]
ARPVVEVRNFLTGQLGYEIYSFGQDIVINPIHTIGTKIKHEQYDIIQTPKSKRKRSRKERIELDVSVKSKKIILTASPVYASQNIVVYANEEPIFTGSLSRNSEINLSLSNKEGRKILREHDRDKDIYAIIK